MTVGLPITIGAAAAITTYAGGRFALRWRHKLHWLIGFSAGAVLGVALFDLFPEAMELVGKRYGVTQVIGVAAVGFFLYLLLNRFLPGHLDADEEMSPAAIPQNSSSDMTERSIAHRNLVGAGSLAVHSMLDGVGIGLAFKVSAAVGIIAAIGVLVHDFSDGINTVSIVMRNHGGEPQVRKWLIANSLAPLVGVLSTYFFTASQAVLGLFLALFCGFFLYIGACDLLPDGYRRHTPAATTILAGLGAATLYCAVQLARR